MFKLESAPRLRKPWKIGSPQAQAMAAATRPAAAPMASVVADFLASAAAPSAAAAALMETAHRKPRPEPLIPWYTPSPPAKAPVEATGEA